MAEYIDRSVLIDKCHPVIYVGMSLGTIGVTLAEIRESPAVDAVEVVRCKDCKHRPITEDFWGIIGPEDENGELDYTCPFLCSDPFYSKIPKDEFYCACGERKMENGYCKDQ